MDPNHARYQLRYTRIGYIIIVRKKENVKLFSPAYSPGPAHIVNQNQRKGGAGHGGGWDKKTQAEEEKRAPLRRGEAAAAAAGNLHHPLRPGLCRPGDRPGAGVPAVLRGGGAGAGRHGFPGGVRPGGGVLLQGRAGGGDLQVPVDGGFPPVRLGR